MAARRRLPSCHHRRASATTATGRSRQGPPRRPALQPSGRSATGCPTPPTTRHSARETSSSVSSITRYRDQKPHQSNACRRSLANATGQSSHRTRRTRRTDATYQCFDVRQWQEPDRAVVDANGHLQLPLCCTWRGPRAKCPYAASACIASSRCHPLRVRTANSRTGPVRNCRTFPGYPSVT